MIQAILRKICMESSEQTGAYISLQICTNRLIFGKGAFFYLVLSEYVNQPIISQIWILLTSRFSSLSQKPLHRKLVNSLPEVNATKKIHNETTFILIHSNSVLVPPISIVADAWSSDLFGSGV